MKVLITGASGHVGGQIQRRLLSLGWEVLDVSRRGTIQADITAPQFAACVSAAAGACDALVHCAAAITKDPGDPRLGLVNCLGAQYAIHTAQLIGASHLIFISSLPVIGRPELLPIDEDHSTRPLSAYHASKLFGEHLIRLAMSAELRTSSLRITSPIGPGTPRGRIFTEFVARAAKGEPLFLAGTGSRRQNYVDVRDIAIGVEQCLQARADGLFNIAAPESLSNLDLARRCIAALHSPSPITFTGESDPEDALSWEVSIKKASATFGYRPRYSIEQSISASLSERGPALRTQS